MRTQDIVIGETYRHRGSPDYCYAKALKIIRPMAKFKQRYAFGFTDEEKSAKCVCVKCEWTLDKNGASGFIKYFRPCDLVKES